MEHHPHLHLELEKLRLKHVMYFTQTTNKKQPDSRALTHYLVLCDKQTGTLEGECRQKRWRGKNKYNSFSLWTWLRNSSKESHLCFYSTNIKLYEVTMSVICPGSINNPFSALFRNNGFSQIVCLKGFWPINYFWNAWLWWLRVAEESQEMMKQNVNM